MLMDIAASPHGRHHQLRRLNVDIPGLTMSIFVPKLLGPTATQISGKYTYTVSQKTSQI